MLHLLPGYELPQLEYWQMQPETGTPGLFLLCRTVEEREQIMRALGWRGENQAASQSA